MMHAPDEQRAQKVVKHGMRVALVDLPDLRVHNSDKAHSSRQTT